MSNLLNDKATGFAACLLFFVKPTVYLSMEYYASRLYLPYYSYSEHFTSNLGVPYPYNDRRTGQPIRSWRANAMNFNFVINGLLYLAGHICLLNTTDDQTDGKLSNARLTTAVLYCIGVILVAAFPGGPRERENGTAILHGIGALLAIGGGDLNCLFAGLAMPSSSLPIYRTYSVLLGVAGLVAIPLGLVFGDHKTEGFWQRCSIYPIQCWEYGTSIMLALQIFRPDLV